MIIFFGPHWLDHHNHNCFALMPFISELNMHDFFNPSLLVVTSCITSFLALTSFTQFLVSFLCRSPSSLICNLLKTSITTFSSYWLVNYLRNFTWIYFQLNENPVLISKLKRQPRIQTAKYNEIVPSPVKTMMTSPFKSAVSNLV